MLATYKLRNNIVQEVSDEFKLPIKFDITMLNMYIGYIFKENASNITRKSLSIVNKLFSIIDVSVYSGEPQMEARINFIKNALDAKLDKGFENREAIINYCRTDIYDQYNEDIINSLPNYSKINYEEIRFINKCTEDRLRYYYVLQYKDDMYNVMERLDSGDYRSFEEINNSFLKMCTGFINKSRSSKTFTTHDEFRLSDDNFDNNLMDIVANLKNPKKMLRTGIQKLNEILSPALIGGRTYIFIGTPGGFKSGLLLKIARDIKKYNKGVSGTKPGKRPTVLLVTMENAVEETVERLFNMVASDDDIRNFTPSQVVKLVKECGEFSLTDSEDIDIVIKYFANRTITTDDLYSLIDDMGDSGSDVIALVFDYIKRIRPAERGKDEKEELKNITNELKSLASHYEIPVITAHQLNRDAAATVDAAMQANKTDLARLLGRGQVGSALTFRAMYQ